MTILTRRFRRHSRHFRVKNVSSGFDRFYHDVGIFADPSCTGYKIIRSAFDSPIQSGDLFELLDFLEKLELERQEKLRLEMELQQNMTQMQLTEIQNQLTKKRDFRRKIDEKKKEPFPGKQVGIKRRF